MKLPLSVLFLSLPVLALGQRESFDASTVRRAEIIVREFEVVPSGKKDDAVERAGRTHQGKAQTIVGSREAVSFENIFFKLDSTELRDEASALQVREIALAMMSPKWREQRFLVEGHTCDLAEDSYNLDLSARRAEVIRQMLIRQGVAPERLAALGFGERDLVEKVGRADSPAEAERKRMKSRRVVLRQIVRGR